MKARISALAALAALLACAAVASEPPDSEVNPQTGNIELVDSVESLFNHDVRYVINTGDGEPPAVVFLTSHPGDDHRPRIEIASDGHTWVVWWRAGGTDEVWVRRKDHSTGGWQAALQVSEAGESSRNPEIIHDGSVAWVAYEFDATAATHIAVRGVGDEPDPFGSSRVVIASTPFGGDADTRIHSEPGSLWVTWVDSATEVGWSVYDYASQSWSTPSTESYAQDDVQAARGRIRITVTGP